MFKKLQNLLFEEEDDEIEDGEVATSSLAQNTIEEKPVQPEPIQPVIESVQPVVEPVSKVELPEPVEEVKEEIKQEVKEVPSFDSVFQEPKTEVKHSSFGITLEDKEPEPIVKETPVKAEPVRKTKIEKPVKETPAYEFKPVISPIFGVDEKDLTAVKNTARKYNKADKVKNDGNVTPVISPIYGSNEADSPSLIQSTVEKSERIEKTVGNVSHFKAEDDIPEFSLDDILLVRDNELNEETDSEIPEEIDDATMVFDKTNFPSEEGLD